MTEPKLVGLRAGTLMATYVKLGRRGRLRVVLSRAARASFIMTVAADLGTRPAPQAAPRGTPDHAYRPPGPALTCRSACSATRDPISTFARTKAVIGQADEKGP